MPVDDLPVHPLVSHRTVPLAGCHSERLKRDAYYIQPLEYRTFTGEIVPTSSGASACRQVGMRTDAGWTHLPDCEGCNQVKDYEYINKSRKDIDNEFSK